MNKGGVMLIPGILIDYLWPQVEPLLEKGRSYWEDFYELDDLRIACKNGSFQLWVQIRDLEVKTVLLTGLVEYPKGIFLRYSYLGGSHLREAMRCGYIIEDWAKSHGAIGFEIIGRPGWASFIERVHLGKKETITGAIWLCGKFEEK